MSGNGLKQNTEEKPTCQSYRLCRASSQNHICLRWVDGRRGRKLALHTMYIYGRSMISKCNSSLEMRAPPQPFNRKTPNTYMHGFQWTCRVQLALEFLRTASWSHKGPGPPSGIVSPKLRETNTHPVSNTFMPGRKLEQQSLVSRSYSCDNF